MEVKVYFDLELQDIRFKEDIIMQATGPSVGS